MRTFHLAKDPAMKQRLAAVAVSLVTTDDLDTMLRRFRCERPLMRRSWNGPPWYGRNLRMKITGLKSYEQYYKTLFSTPPAEIGLPSNGLDTEFFEIRQLETCVTKALEDVEEQVQ